MFERRIPELTFATWRLKMATWQAKIEVINIKYLPAIGRPQSKKYALQFANETELLFLGSQIPGKTIITYFRT